VYNLRIRFKLLPRKILILLAINFVLMLINLCTVDCYYAKSDDDYDPIPINSDELIGRLLNGKLKSCENKIIEGDVVLSGKLKKISSDISIVHCMINGTTDFTDVEFLGRVDFNQTIFNGDARFDRAIFRKPAIFSQATFLGLSKFQNTRWSHANFMDVSFKKKLWV